MEKPSPQFINKLEKELRMAYQANYQKQPEMKKTWLPAGIMNFSKFFLPVFSGGLVLLLIIWNLNGGIFTPLSDRSQNSVPTNTDSNFDERIAAFNETSQEEQIAQDFDNGELNQIDNNVKFVAQSNF